MKVLFLLLLVSTSVASIAAEILSHPSQRPLPVPSDRPLGTGPHLFVDANNGSDENDGSQARPWATLNHALTELQAGETLVLRGGVYYETVTCSLAGTPEKPITIRSHPGEMVILDGSFSEFFRDPSRAWIPWEKGAPGEYRSARAYRNIVDVAGMFGDSNVGLFTYWRIEDLRSDNETWRRHPEKKVFDLDLYCGPGVFYDRESGHLHCRLAPTNNPDPVENYRGAGDPRLLALVIGPVNAVPLHLDHARHVRIRDLVVRGGGEKSIFLEFCTGIELDGVTALCGNVTGRNSGPVTMTHCAIHGRVPPWMWRIDSSKGCASSASRDVVRMINPTLLETSHQYGGFATPRQVINRVRGGGDDEVMPQMLHYPRNHDWEITWSEFTDGHDGVFLVGRDMVFRHNFIEDIQDDAIDISAAMPGAEDRMILTGNLIRRSLTAFSSHNYNVHWPRGEAVIARNIVDLREGIRWIRRSEEQPGGQFRNVGFFLLHGSDAAEFIESVSFYHNTCIAPTMGNYAYAHRTMFHMKPESRRRVFNNLFVYLNDDGRYPPPLYGVTIDGKDLRLDGNLHWNPHPEAVVKPGFFDKLREYPGMAAHELAADPEFVAFSPEGGARNDYRLSEGSPAIDGGVVIPEDWNDPITGDAGKPDIGAIPFGAGEPRFGRNGRIRMNAGRSKAP